MLGRVPHRFVLDLDVVLDGALVLRGDGVDDLPVGEGVAAPAAGTRVAIHHHTPCGECRRCRRGHETLCERFRATRLDPGGFAERVRISQDLVPELLELPEAHESGRIILDLSRLSSIDWWAALILLWVGRMVSRRGGTLVLASPQPAVARLLTTAGAAQVVTVYQSVQQAYSSRRRSRGHGHQI